MRRNRPCVAGLDSGYSVDGIGEYSIAQKKTYSTARFLSNLFTNGMRTQATSMTRSEGIQGKHEESEHSLM